MAAKRSLRCTKCGRIIVGDPYQIDGDDFCATCYSEELQARKKLNAEKADLYDYLKKLFNIDECPETTKRTINRALASGKTLRGIRNTISYYYEIIQAEEPNNIGYLSLIIDTQYEEAKKYWVKIEKLRDINSKVEIKKDPKVIVIERPEPSRRVGKMNLEDFFDGKK